MYMFIKLVTQPGHLYGEEVNIVEAGCFIRGRGYTVFVMVRGEVVVYMYMYVHVMVRGVLYVAMSACEKDEGGGEGEGRKRWEKCLWWRECM